MRTLALETTSVEVRRAARLARREVLVLTEKGRPAFAIVGVGDSLALEALALGRNSAFMALLDQSSRQARRGPRYSLEQIRQELGIGAAPRAPHRTRRR
jgi:hypothetical protein